MADINNFFVIGGTLGSDAASYVQRSVDDDLFHLLLEGEFCNVLAARQTGKSSLMVRTAERLERQGIKTVIVDLTSIGSDVSASEWYFGLLSHISRKLKLHVDELAWWQSQREKSPVQRFSNYLREVVLEEVHVSIVVFIDEIDSTLKLKFTDDFFAAIRAAYNARSQDAAFKRLTFVLLGVARPADLIKDHIRTPYNIGVSVDVTDFDIHELNIFSSVLEDRFPGQGLQILEWVLNWTGGQPYLTQKLCSEIIKQPPSSFSQEKLAYLVQQLFLGEQARTETNLRSIRDRMSNNPYGAKMLRIYRQVLTNQQVKAEERSIEQNELKLVGLVKITRWGVLRVRNRIYANVFDENWIQDTMPSTLPQRLAVVTSVLTVLATALAVFFFYQQRTQAVEIRAQTYIDTFNQSSSQEVKIANLAGLFGLGGSYVVQAREIFDSLEYQDRLTLFDLSTPSNVGDELVIVVDGTYQYIEDTPEGNVLLRAMANVLEQTTSFGAAGLVVEINAWLDGREAAGSGQYDVAVALYTRAWDRSEQRGRPNLEVLFDRALVYVSLKQYNNALMDFDKIVEADSDRAVKVNMVILSDDNIGLSSYFQEHSGEYVNLDVVVFLPTVIRATEPPIINFTPTPLPSKIVDTRGVEMVLVPAGEFGMGGNTAEIVLACRRHYPDCRSMVPDVGETLIDISLDDFYIDKYEVSNGEYKICVDEGKCDLPLKTTSASHFNYYGNPEFNDYPVIYVDWSMAKNYCEWRGVRLPTEAEWEKAARGTGGLKFPWGDEIDCTKANYVQGNSYCVGDTAPVGSYPDGKSIYGVYNMAGNVWEWVSSLGMSYPYDANDGREDPNASGLHILRGGSWASYDFYLYTSYRGYYFPEYGYSYGFRCAKDVP